MRIAQSKRPGMGVEALERPAGPPPAPWRPRLVLAALALGAGMLVARAAYLQMGQGEFLQDQGIARHVRTVSTSAPRGVIRDRHGTPLAMSTAVESVWMDPREAMAARERWPELAAAIGLDPARVERRLIERAERSFVYLRRHVDPETAARVRRLAVPGVYFQREFRRYYPEAEVAAHVVGFAGIDGAGREGAELGLDAELRGVAGKKLVLQDRFGHSVEDVQNVRSGRPGRDVHLTIDLRLQSLAYRALKAAVRRHQAVSGSLVVIGARTGEIHALVNQPSYNQNDPAQRSGSITRNRAATDFFEPGSTVKPFAVAAALEAGVIRTDTVLDTSPGYLRIGRHTVRDRRDLGLLDVTEVLKLSSNVGVSRITLDTPPARLREVFQGVGFGSHSGSGAVGESSGFFKPSRKFGKFERATLSYGYGLAVTALQLARAYTLFANEGERLDLRLVRAGGVEGAPPSPAGHPVVTRDTARTVLAMLEAVVEAKDGTGRRARVPGYRVAGKTGTSRKAIAGGYAKGRYTALFIGLAPVSDPRFIVAVIVDEPQGEYYGGQVAAPVFRSVMSDALRLDAVPPDSLRTPLRNAEDENYDYAMRDLPG